MGTATFQSGSGKRTLAIHLSKSLDAQIRAHAEKDYPMECCGVLLGTVGKTVVAVHHPADRATCDMEVREEDLKVVTELRPLQNVHEEGHERRFRIAPDAFFHVERDARAAGLKVLGFYHSHPDHPAEPSEYDREWAWPWYSYIIVSVRNG